METLLLVLMGIVVLLILLGTHECFVDSAFMSSGVGVATAVQRPPSDTTSPLYATWLSKIEAQAPIGADNSAYITALQSFFDTVYEPATDKPTTADVETFLAGPNVAGKPVDPSALRLIIVDAFHIDSSTTGAAKELEQVKFQPDNTFLQPSDGRDEVRTRSEGDYFPADPTLTGPLPEGNYAPVNQQQTPRHSRSIGSFYDVCSETPGGACEQNVL